MAIIEGATKRDEMWGMTRGIELLSQTAQLILTPRRWFLTRNTWLIEKLKEEHRQLASPLQGKKWTGMRNPHCHLEKLHQELNLWHRPKTSGGRWSIRISAWVSCWEFRALQNGCNWGRWTHRQHWRTHWGSGGSWLKCHHWASLWCQMER